MHLKKSKSLIFALLMLSPSLVFAHIEKTFDKNGGHYNNSGEYHCHVQNCKLTESRWQRRRMSVSAPRDSDFTFHEDDWPYWQVVNGNCQDSRNQVLVLTSQIPVTFSNPRNCTVREGLWIDEYTGEEYTRAAQLEIDHIISPLYAHSSDGYQWNEEKRLIFSNDPANLIPVSRATARKKRQRGIGSWQPREEFQCDYAQAWQDIADLYELRLFGKERSRINKILESCDIQTGVISQDVTD